jgi:hypothetical protein
VLWLLLVALGAAAFGQSGQPDAGDRISGPASASTQAGGGIEAEGGGFSVTHHELNIRGERIAYTATAGHLPLTDDAGKPQEFVRCTVAQMCKVGSDEPRSGGYQSEHVRRAGLPRR